MKMSFYMLLYRAFHAQRKCLRPFMAKIGLAPGQPKVLMYLADHEGCMQKDVAEHCDIEPATASRILDTLEKNGFIVRRTMAGNRRAGSLSITEQGREAAMKWEAHCHEVEAMMLSGFTEEEKTMFTGFLSRSYKNMSGKDAR